MSKFLCASVILIATITVGYLTSCEKSNLPDNHDIGFKAHLSEYHIYTGGPGSLAFLPPYRSYTIATPLFSDYAEKQRLIKIPAGTKLIAKDDGLPGFPDSTIIVKTFYYFRNRTD